MSFTRRYQFVPDQATIQEIEGQVIVDLPPPQQVPALNEGVTCVIGEFADCTYAATQSPSSGLIVTNPQPTQVISPSNLTGLFGGFDPTIGDFGRAMGNGFIELRNKSFVELVIVPVNLASSTGMRLHRQLPVNAIDPVTGLVKPAFALLGGVVQAGTTLLQSNNQVNVASQCTFTAQGPTSAGTDGATTGSSTTTMAFTSVSGATQPLPNVGDVIQLDLPGQTCNLIQPVFGGTAGSSPETVLVVDQNANFPTAGQIQIGTEAFTYTGIGTVQIPASTGPTYGTFTGVSQSAFGTTGPVGATTTLSAPASTTATILTLTSNTGFSTTGGYALISQSGPAYEIISYTGKSGSTITGCQRGLFGTTPLNLLGTEAIETQRYMPILSPLTVGTFYSGSQPVTGLTNSNTYRIATVATGGSPTSLQLTLEQLNYATFVDASAGASASTLTSFSGTGLAWRIHPSATALSSPLATTAQLCGNVFARPLTSTITVSGTPVAMVPLAPVSPSTAVQWLSLSGLGAVAPATITYTPQVQAKNAPNSPQLDALYSVCFDSTLSDDDPERDINIIWAARKSAGIRAKHMAHMIQAQSQGLGRVGPTAPPLSTSTYGQVAELSVIGNSGVGVGTNRDRTMIYDWPGLITFVPEAVGIAIMGADGVTHVDGNIDTTSDGWLASIMSNLAPERNPGQASEPVPTIMSNVSGFQRNAPSLGMPDYIALKAAGICAPKNDPTAGFVFQSGINTSLTAGTQNIKQRRFSFFLEDSLAAALTPFSKELENQANKDAIDQELTAFMEGLLSTNDPQKQRILKYAIDYTSGNVPVVPGIYTLIVYCQMLSTLDNIVAQVACSENQVVVTTQ